MKRLFFILLLPILSFGCKKDENGIRLPFTVDFEIGAGSNPLSAPVFCATLANTSNFILDQNNLTAADITKITGRSARIYQPFSSIELDFIEEIIVRVYSVREDCDDLSIIGTEVFYREDIPFRDVTINLIPSLPDVKEQLLADQLYIEIETRLREISPLVELRMDFDFLASY